MNSTIEALRRDVWRSDAGRTYPDRNALALRMPGRASADVAIWSWKGPGHPLERNGRPIRAQHPLDFGVRLHGAGGAVLSVSFPTSVDAWHRARPVRIDMPLVIPDAHWRARYPYWAGTDDRR
jgi:hypothetical protein